MIHLKREKLEKNNIYVLQSAIWITYNFDRKLKWSKIFAPSNINDISSYLYDFHQYIGVFLDEINWCFLFLKIYKFWPDWCFFAMQKIYCNYILGCIKFIIFRIKNLDEIKEKQNVFGARQHHFEKQTMCLLVWFLLDLGHKYNSFFLKLYFESLKNIELIYNSSIFFFDFRWLNHIFQIKKLSAHTK